MLTVPFLTDIDRRAEIKGSRDPLGAQPIWTRLGRHLVGNLTTVSTSFRDFTTLLLGYHFAERLAAEETGDGDLAVFLKWEQLAAYARGVVNDDWGFRGTERARKNVAAKGGVRLGADSTAQILGNQKIYGLWGLYTVPARSSGLVEGDPTRLTPAGRALVENVYLPIFTKAGVRGGEAIERRLAEDRPNIDLGGRDKKLVEATAKVLSKGVHEAERQPLRAHLLLGGPQDKTGGAQEILVRALRSTLDDTDYRLSPARVKKLADAARKDGELGPSVANRLERIRTAELLIAPAVALFDLVLASDGQTLTEVAGVVRKHWGDSLPTIDRDATAALEGELKEATGGADAGARWVELADALARGDHAQGLSLLMAQNSFVMGTRGGAPWVDVRQGKLHVRFRDEQLVPMPALKELPGYWRHPYFLDSLRAMAIALREG